MTSTTFFFVFIPLLAVILLAINLIFAPHNPYQEKDNVFECGFHSFLGQNRTQFSISFFIFALLFLLFDLEILLVYPYVVSAHTNGIYGLAIMLIFFLALTLGFAFELGKNALKIDSRQMVTLSNYKFTTISTVSSFSNFIHKRMANIRLATICGGIMSAAILASAKYTWSGSLLIDYSDWSSNFGMGLLAWTVSSNIIAWFTEHWGIKGINFNLNQVWYGMNTMNLGDKSSPSVKEFKPKLYNAMDVDPDPDSEPKPDKGKGVDKGPRSRSSSPIMGEQEQGSGTRSPSPILSAEVGGPQFILNDLRHQLGISDGNLRIRINKLRRELYFLDLKNEDISKISDELLKLEALRDRVYKRGSIAAQELRNAIDAIGETNSLFQKLAYEASYPIQNSEPSGSLNNTRSSVSSSQSDKDLAEAIALSLQSLDSDKNEPGEGSSKK